MAVSTWEFAYSVFGISVRFGIPVINVLVVIAFFTGAFVVFINGLKRARLLRSIREIFMETL